MVDLRRLEDAYRRSLITRENLFDVLVRHAEEPQWDWLVDRLSETDREVFQNWACDRLRARARLWSGLQLKEQEHLQKRLAARGWIEPQDCVPNIPSGRQWQSLLRHPVVWLVAWIGGWLPITIAADFAQFRYFPCNFMPAISLGVGLFFFGGIAGLPLVLLQLAVDVSLSWKHKIGYSLMAIAVAVVLLGAAYFVLLLTHMCR